MISDLDEVLKRLLVERIPLDPTEVDITFDIPSRDWSGGLAKPTVNLYLYDIRENRELREADWWVDKENGRASKRKPPVRIDLSYMITAWTRAIEDEHRLLWQVLATLLRHDTIPEELLQGDLARQAYPLRTKVAQPDGALSNPADFWSALENLLKPSINYVLTVAVDLEAIATAPLVFTKIARVRDVAHELSEEVIQVGGTVRSKDGDRQPLSSARVTIRETGATAVTDEEGRFRFANVPRGKYTIDVLAPDGRSAEMGITVPGQYDVEA
mgnify:CR=1 FL=1